MPPTQIIIDTDPGVDDALAFLLALASPEVKLEALTTTQGNVTLEKPPAMRLPSWNSVAQSTSRWRGSLCPSFSHCAAQPMCTA